MKIITRDEVIRKLTIPACIEVMRRALVGLECGDNLQPMRSIHRLPREHTFGFMPAYLGQDGYFGAKVINACHANIGTDYPSHAGYVLLFEAVHGIPVAMVDATAVTMIRTGAVSGVATDLLARKDAHVLALIGAGAQARSHIQAMLAVREISRVLVYDLIIERARAFADEASAKYKVPIEVCASAKEAARTADIVCTLTPATEPYLKAEWVRPGTHVNAVGAFTPVTREVTSELVAAARLYADSVESMKKECGEYLVPKKEGLIDEGHIVGSIGGVMLGKAPGRQSVDEITLFDALGLAVEDVASALYVYSAENGQ